MFTGSVSGLDKANRLGDLSQVVQNDWVKKIKSVKDRGLLEPFETELSKPSSFWGKETWLDLIKQIINEENSGKPISETTCLLCFLFAVAIDSELTIEEKQSLIAKTHKSLEKDQLENLYCVLGNDLYPIELPTVMSTNILQFCVRDVWEESCKRVLRFREDSYKTFIHWVEGVVDNQWPLEEKQAFLDKIFDVLPSKTGQEVLYFFMLHSPEDFQKLFSKTCSPVLAKKIEDLKGEVIQFGQYALSGAKSKGERVRMDFRGNQRQYFLEWFYKNGIHHENAPLILIDFSERDWEWLQKQMNQENETHFGIKDHSYHLYAPVSPRRYSPAPLIFLAMKWMIDIANRLALKELPQSSTIRDPDVNLFLFFEYASLAIEKEKGWEDISNEDYQNFAKFLTAEDLFNYFDAFKGDLGNRTIKNLINTEPKKLISWLQIILKIPENECKRSTSKIISELFLLIAKNECSEIAIRVIFDIKQYDDILKLSIFCALRNEHRKEILKHILSERADGIKTLAQWIELCLPGTGDLKSYVKHEFAKDIYVLLQETVADELEIIIDKISLIQSSLENKKFIESSLPIGLNLSDLFIRQKEAIKKLQDHFLTPEIPYGDRSHFVACLREDLKVGEDTSVQLLKKLFNQLPKETWPLIFFHFKRTIDRSFFPMRKEAKEGPLTPHCVLDLQYWIDLAAQTLTQMIDNPCLSCKDDDLSKQSTLIMQSFYHITDRSKTISAVIQKFIELEPYELFIPIMNTLAYTNFYHSIEEFNKLISTALDHANIDKATFIAKCMIAQYQRSLDPTKERRIWSYRLEHKFWKEPYLKAHEERSAVSKILIDSMGIHFLGYFNQSWEQTWIIKSLKMIDQAYLEQAFYEWVNLLGRANNRMELKFQIFQNICDSFANVEIDVFKLLQHEILKESLQEIKKWYSSDDVIDGYLDTMSASSVSLLHFFNKEGFYSAIFRKIEEIITKEKWASFFTLNLSLKALDESGYKDELLNQLFEGQQKVVELMKECFEKYLIEAFSDLNAAQSIPLACKWIPDWKKRLISWTIEQIKKDKERFIQWESEPDYYEILKLFESLNNVKMLDDFMVSLKAEASEEFSRDVIAIYEKFHEKNK